MHLIIKTDSSNYVIITIQYIKIGANKYEITALAKATLALGILTTGVFTTESKAVHAKVELDETQRKYYINMLINTILKKVLNQQISVKSEDYYGSNVLNFKQRNKAFKVFYLVTIKINKRKTWP